MVDAIPGYYSIIAQLLGPALGQLTGAMAKRFSVTDMDKEGLQLRKDEFESRERQFIVNLANSRENLLLQFENQRENQDYQRRLDRWPLYLPPISILRESKRRNSYSLNLIVVVVDTNDNEFYRGAGRGINQTIDMVSHNSLPIAERAAWRFSDDIVCYRETLKSSRLIGDNLRTSMHDMLENEPTVLIEIRVPHPDQVEYHVSHWGLPFDKKTTYSRDDILPLNLRSLPLPVKTGDADDNAQYQQIVRARSIAVGLAMAGLVVSIGDTFRTLQRPHALPAPVFPQMMTDPTFGLLPTGTQVPETMWSAAKHSYLSTYDSLAQLNRPLASELAAKAALTAHMEKQSEFAKQLLEKSLQLSPLSTITTLTDEIPVMAALRKQRIGNQLSELENAVVAINGWVSKSGGNMYLTHADIARRLGPKSKD